MEPIRVSVGIPIEYNLTLNFYITVFSVGDLSGHPHYGDRSRHVINSLSISNYLTAKEIRVKEVDIDFWLDVVEDEFDDALHETLQAMFN